jgi:hypothetical protein
MLSADENEDKPVGKPPQRKKTDTAKKGETRKRKDAQSPKAKPDQLLEALQRLGEQPIAAPAAEEASTPVLEQASAPVVPSESPVIETPAPEVCDVEVTERVETPVSLKTIADAYGDYSRKSLEQTSDFVARLATTRSLSGALELQTAFAREAYETFIAETRKIRELHREMAKQRLSRLEGLVTGTKKAR